MSTGLSISTGISMHTGRPGGETRFKQKEDPPLLPGLLLPSFLPGISIQSARCCR